MFESEEINTSDLSRDLTSKRRESVSNATKAGEYITVSQQRTLKNKTSYFQTVSSQTTRWGRMYQLLPTLKTCFKDTRNGLLEYKVFGEGL